MAISKWQRRQLFYDKVQRGFVNCSVVVTCLAAVLTVYHGYNFFVNVRSESAKHQRFLQEEMLKEGQYPNEANNEV